MDSEEYLHETEHVVKQLFESLAYYHQILEEMPKPIFSLDIKSGDIWDKAYGEWCETNEEDINKSAEMSKKYFSLSFSQATICGSILQIASMGIYKFSNNEHIPDTCREFIEPSQKAKRYCIGREVRSIPIGIIIYAGRNQYNHWDNPSPHRITKNVFEIISKSHGYGEVVYPAFDLSNPILKIYSHNILALLGWSTYNQYVKDMYELIAK